MAVQEVEGMFGVGLRSNAEGVIVRISEIEEIAYLRPSKPVESWLVNNSIDLETWNTIYD